MSVHEVAQQGFGSEAAAYEAGRPSSPPELVAWLAEHLRIEPGRRVVDLAAGTGKLTRLLAPLGADLYAVEPVEGMRVALAQSVPGVPIAAATAEALPFADGSLDAITVAQAFHWFDHARALAEMRRALRIGGRFALVWNARDRSVDWVDGLWSIMDRVEKRAPWRDHDNWRDIARREAPGIGPLHQAEFHHVQTLDRAGAVTRVTSVSHVAVLPPDERAAVVREVEDLLDTHPDTRGCVEFRIPYRVDAFWAERTD